MEYLQVLTVIIILLTYLIISGQAQFTVQPLSVERAEGLKAVFRCQYQAEGFSVSYNWFINNSIVSTDTETIRVHPPSSPGGPVTLTILATPQHNNSVVQCVATIRNGIVIVRSEVSTTATLTVHGTIITDVLTAPNTITVMWNALPLTEYCVDITESTLDSTQTVVLDSVCGLVNEYIFTYPNPISVCDRFSFTVTPTEGEIRGTTSEPVTGFFTRAEGSTEGPHRIRESGENKSVEFKATIPSCTRFTRYRVDSDLLTPSINRLITDPLLFDGSLSFSFPTDKMTEYSVTLTDENGIDLVFENIKISTFDVQGVLVSECPGGGCISASIEYVGTVSPGALVCVIRIIDGELDFTNTKVMTIPRSRSDNFTILAVPSGNYRVMTFDLECNSLPRMPISIAADSRNISITVSSEDGGQPPSSEGVSATRLPNGDAQVTCADSDIVSLVLFQSTINLDRILVALVDSFVSSTTFSVSDTFANGHVIVYSWNSSQSIFDGKVSLITKLNPPTSAPSTLSPTDPPPVTGSQFPLATGVIAGITVVVILLLLVVIVVGAGIVICLKKRKKKQNEVTIQAPESDGQVDWCSTFPVIEQTNEAYAPVLKKNIAYEQTKKPRRQRIDNSQAPVTIEGEYESIEPVHEYEDVLPKTK